MSVVDRVLGWRASRPTTVKVTLPARGNVGVLVARPSSPPATPVCGAVDRLSGAVCTQPVDHPPVPMAMLRPVEDRPRIVRQWGGRHVDLSDPGCPIVWATDDWTDLRGPR